MMSVRVSELISPAFYDVHRDVKAHGHTHYWLHGGRGSFKSTFVATEVVLLLLRNPDANAVVLRKVADTLRDSVYTQIQWAIDKLGLTDKFSASLSPLRFTYKPTGQRIMFRGLDKAEKARGLTFSKGYGAVIWFEELPNFDSIEEIRDILNTIRRGGDTFWCFYTFNPPKTPWSWVNQETIARQQRDDTLVHQSTYLDNMATHAHWLGQPFIDEAELLRTTNPKAYEWEMLGKVTGTGGMVFENLVPRPVTDEEIYSFERVYNGVDFGWFPDPWTLVRCELQPAERRIIIFEEHSAIKSLPEQTADIIKQALTYKTKQTDAAATFHNDIVWCDDTADGKGQMYAYRRHHGINAHPSPKGNMRKQSYYWLAGLREIVIDPVRCPEAFKEFSLCEYKKDRQGNWLDDFNDGNDHFIDAVRYALMNHIVRSR